MNSLTQEQLENDLYKDWDAEKLLGGDVSRLSKFVTELHSYTNTLAGKRCWGIELRNIGLDGQSIPLPNPWRTG